MVCICADDSDSLHTPAALSIFSRTLRKSEIMFSCMPNCFTHAIFLLKKFFVCFDDYVHYGTVQHVLLFVLIFFCQFTDCI